MEKEGELNKLQQMTRQLNAELNSTKNSSQTLKLRLEEVEKENKVDLHHHHCYQQAHIHRSIYLMGYLGLHIFISTLFWQTLSGQLEDQDGELAAEKRNSLKRDKTIQGLSLLLKEKEKEV